MNNNFTTFTVKGMSCVSFSYSNTMTWVLPPVVPKLSEVPALVNEAEELWLCCNFCFPTQPLYRISARRLKCRWFKLWVAQQLSGWHCHLTAERSCGVLSVCQLWTGNPSGGFACFLLNAMWITPWPWIRISGDMKWINGWILRIFMHALELNIAF